MKTTFQLFVAASTVALAACQQPGANLGANVYRAGQVNQVQAAKVVIIKAVLPAKIEVDNSQAQAQARVASTLLLGVGGAFLGNSISGHYRGIGTLAGATGGAAVGNAVGGLVPATTLVDGVSLTYEEDGQLRNSAQVGRTCEFSQGRAIVIATGAGETRIQANRECPVKS
jgi:outer membrane lipoprotein SlyB